jgi:protein involved in polysaccharide export with SLBB domain
MTPDSSVRYRTFLLPAARACAVILIAAMLGGCAAPLPQSTTVVRPASSVVGAETVAGIGPPPSAYVVGVGDEVEIKFTNHSELNETAKVRTDGRIALQLIGGIDAAGRTPEQIEALIAERFTQMSADAIAPARKQYVIGPDDEIEVRFPYLSSLDQTVRVRPDGKVSLSLIRTVVAQGKTPEQFQDELMDRYRAHVRNPELVVNLRTYSRSRVVSDGRPMLSGLADLRPTVLVRGVAPLQVFVGGEVARPGAVAYQPPVTLLQAIIQAGGTRPTAEMRSVVVLRKTSGGEALVIRRDLKSDVEGGITNDIYLAPYDVVVVPKTAIAATAEAIDQYVWQVLPPLRNTYFGFIYQLNTNSTTTVRNQP